MSAQLLVRTLLKNINVTKYFHHNKKVLKVILENQNPAVNGGHIIKPFLCVWVIKIVQILVLLPCCGKNIYHIIPTFSYFWVENSYFFPTFK